MSRPLVLALAQVPGRRADDLSGFADHARRTCRAFPQTQLLAYPELHLVADADGREGPRAVLASARPVGSGPRHDALAALAAELGVWLCPGSLSEVGDGGRVHNTAVVYSPTGELAASYRKVFPWRPFEQAHPGREFVVFPIPGVGTVGLSICYDAWFPETTRHLAWMGADIVLNLVRTDTVDRAQEIVLARANATVNQVFVAGVNAAGPAGLGHSVLVGPEGDVLAELPGATPGTLTAVVDLDRVDTVRRFGSFALTRPWEQLRDGDDPIPMPLYGGEITAKRWTPRGRP